ncbi:MAG: hypothetical protein WBF20_08645, partial [Trebonia sp.]|uniref:hypothetical protein n=1 Tax=Trebonia sp. TaxID=2767075 RepID=UPI003C773FDA
RHGDRDRHRDGDPDADPDPDAHAHADDALSHSDQRRSGHVLTAIRRVPVNAVSCPQQGTGKKEKRPS